MKKLFTIITLLILTNTYAQNIFEEGYVITPSNDSIPCLIKNMDWLNNPSSIEYKLTENDEVKTYTINQIKEFKILNKFRYVKEKINIEISSNEINNLDYSKYLKLQEREILLKEIISGDASLYEYRQNEILNYFYKINQNPIKLLEYKSYLIDAKTVSYNKNFQQELLINLTCENMSINDFKNLDYKENKLTKVFEKYNKCKNPDQIITQFKKPNPIHLWVKPRFNTSNIEMYFALPYKVYKFHGNSSVGLGAEIEYTLPFNNNQWSFFAEPNYVSFNSDFKDSNQKIDFEYKNIEIPVGVRYGYFITPKSKIFGNIAYVVGVDLGSKLKVDNPKHYTDYEIKLKSNPYFTFGIGYVYNNRWGIELRKSASTNTTKNIKFWSSGYNITSFILSYRIF